MYAIEAKHDIYTSNFDILSFLNETDSTLQHNEKNITLPTRN
jgi:hypothetical protein